MAKTNVSIKNVDVSETTLTLIDLVATTTAFGATTLISDDNSYTSIKGSVALHAAINADKAIIVIDSVELSKAQSLIWLSEALYYDSIKRDRTIFVDKLGVDPVIANDYDGLAENPFLTIAKAIAWGLDHSASKSNPMVARVGIGTFVEDLILKDGVNIEGRTNSLSNVFSTYDTKIQGDITLDAGVISDLCKVIISNVACIDDTKNINCIGTFGTFTPYLIFKNCAISSNISITQTGIVIFENCYIDSSANIVVEDESILVLKNTIVTGGLDIDSTSQLSLFESSFDREASNIDVAVIQNSIRIATPKWNVVSIVTSDSPYSANVYEFIEADPSAGNIVIPFPDATKYKGYEIKVKNSSLINMVTPTAFGSQLIEGSASIDMMIQNQCITFTSNGVGWSITGSYL